MTVEHIKNIEPLSETYELKPECKYIIRIPKNIGMAGIEPVREAMLKIGINPEQFIVCCGDIAFYEIKS
jgi:hypothetical protein